jgi:hypothetical protein
VGSYRAGPFLDFILTFIQLFGWMASISKNSPIRPKALSYRSGSIERSQYRLYIRVIRVWGCRSKKKKKKKRKKERKKRVRYVLGGKQSYVP